MNLNTRNREKIGGIAIHKGKTAKSDTPVVLWDAVPPCEPEECPIEEECPYQKCGRCTLRNMYQKNIVDSVLSSVDDVTSEQMLIIGMHLIPLYSQLIQMKIHALKAPTLVVSRGSMVANPIFKEIREIIKTITTVLRDLNLNGDGKLGGLVADPLGKGDSSYYATLMEQD